jgi:hypothetical protein
MTEANLSPRLPDPSEPIAGTSEVFLRYLGYFRAALAARLRALPEAALTSSRVPSGWTPLELLKHLTYVELRWLDWGFEGQDVGDPWGDRKDDRWHVAPGETLDSLLADHQRRAVRSDQIIIGHALGDIGQPGERWDGNPPAMLERVLFHLLQEYARHLGHLDIVAELAGGTTGE